jgi:hypothetical protein
MIVVHLRNPFDTQHTPDGVVQIQTWGYRPDQWVALANVLRGTCGHRRLDGPVP